MDALQPIITTYITFSHANHHQPRTVWPIIADELPLSIHSHVVNVHHGLDPGSVAGSIIPVKQPRRWLLPPGLPTEMPGNSTGDVADARVEGDAWMVRRVPRSVANPQHSGRGKHGPSRICLECLVRLVSVVPATMVGDGAKVVDNRR